MGKAFKDTSGQERTVSPESAAEPPLKAVVQGPLSPARSTNIAESSREPEGRLPAADELSESSEQRLAVLKRIQELEIEGALPEKRDAARARKKLLKDTRTLCSNADIADTSKVDQLQDKIGELVSAQARLENELIPLRRQVTQAVREKEEAKSEAQRTLAVNAKLQELCRTLQQQNKAVLEQAKVTVSQEQLSRQEFTEKVGETLKSVTFRIEEQTKERDLQQKENAELRDRLGEIDSKWTLREELFQKQLTAKAQEIGLWEERVAEQQQLLETAVQREAGMQEQVDTMRSQVGETSAMLEQHLGNYSKYQDTITHSNQVLQQLQTEDEHKQAMIKLLEKAKRLKDKQLKQAQQCADRATESLTEAVQQSKHLAQLVELAGGQQQVQELPKLLMQKQTLENLCRVLQEENKRLKAQLPSNRQVNGLPDDQHQPGEGNAIAQAITDGLQDRQQDGCNAVHADGVLPMIDATQTDESAKSD